MPRSRARTRKNVKRWQQWESDFPGVAHGLRGMLATCKARVTMPQRGSNQVERRPPRPGDLVLPFFISPDPLGPCLDCA